AFYDVTEGCRRGLFIQVRVEETDWAAEVLIHQGNQARPQRRDSAGSADNEVRAVDPDQVSGVRICVTGHIRNTSPVSARHASRALIGGHREYLAHATASGIPCHLGTDQAVAGFKLRAAASEH